MTLDIFYDEVLLPSCTFISTFYILLFSMSWECGFFFVFKQVYFPKEKWQEILAYLTGIRETDSRIRLIVKGGSAGTPLSLIFEFGNNLKYQQKQLQFQLLHYLLYNALKTENLKGCCSAWTRPQFLYLHNVFSLYGTTKNYIIRSSQRIFTCSYETQDFRYRSARLQTFSTGYLRLMFNFY